MVKADILVGVRGPKGGYRLARERRRITVGDIVRVIANADGGDDILEDADGSDLGLKVVRPLWAELREAAMVRLDDTTIDALCLKAHEAGVDSEGRPNLDFTI